MMRRIIKTFFYFALFIILIGCKTKNPIEIAAGKVFAGINLQAVTDDLILPSEIEGVAITWVSGDPDVVTSEGEVFRQEEDVTVDLYAYFSYENLSDNKKYTLTVVGLSRSATERIEYVKRRLLRGQTSAPLRSDLVLPEEVSGVAISWVSSKPDVLDNTGKIYPLAAAVEVDLYAYLSYNGLNDNKIFKVTVAAYDRDDMDKLIAVRDGLFAGIDKDNVVSDLDFPTEIDGVRLEWQSDDPETIDNAGIVYRRAADVTVSVTVKLSYRSAMGEKTFVFTVLADDTADNALVQAVLANLLQNENLDEVTEDLDLPKLVSGVAIKWESGDPAVVTNEGRVFRADDDRMVSLKATLTYNRAKATKTFTLKVKARDTQVDDWEWLQSVKESLLSGVDLDNVTENLYFPLEVGEVLLSWESDNPAVIDNEGAVTRGVKDEFVTVTVSLEYRGLTDEAVFLITVKKIEQTLSEYYRGAEGLTGAELKAFLHNIIKDHYEYAYKSTTELLMETDEDPENPNNVILFYTGRSEPKSSYNSQVWNKEHVWAKSHGNFGTSRPAGSDIHNLRPTDSQVNSIRGNKDFDEGGTLVSPGRGYAPGSSFNYSDSNSFEPRDEVKGDVARILFYMATRYEGESGEPDLELNDCVGNGSEPYHGKLSVLLIWHKEDPVDDFERNRNEVIYSYQNNRNPFIDYPEFVDLIWGEKANANQTAGIQNILFGIIVDLTALRRNNFTLFIHNA